MLLKVFVHLILTAVIVLPKYYKSSIKESISCMWRTIREEEEEKEKVRDETQAIDLSVRVV